MTSGAMLRLQTLDHLLQEEGRRYMADINALYPPEVVAYYREGLPGPGLGHAATRKRGGGSAAVEVGHG